MYDMTWQVTSGFDAVLDLKQWTPACDTVALWRLVANRDIRAPSSPITNCSCWPCRMPRHVPVRNLILSRDRFGRTSTAEVFEDAANHHNTHTEKNTIYIYISKHHEGSFWPFLLDLGISMNIKSLKGDDSTVLYVFLCIFVGQNDSRTSFSEVQRCLAGHDLWVKPGGFVSSVVDMSWLGFFPVFDWNCYQQTTIYLKKWGSSYFNGEFFILKVMLTSSHANTYIIRSGEIRAKNPSANRWFFSPQRSSLKGWGSGPTPNSANTPVFGDAQFDVFFSLQDDWWFSCGCWFDVSFLEIILQDVQDVLSMFCFSFLNDVGTCFF